MLRLTGLAAAASAGLIALGTAASASGPASPVMSALPDAAAMAAGPQALHETYACDTSVLRPNSSGPNLGSLNPTAVLTVPASGVAGQTAKVTLAVAATPLSPAISAVLPAVNSIDLTSTASVNATSGPGVSFSATSGPVAAQAAELPAITATGSLPLTVAGTTTVYFPADLHLMLNAGGKQYLLDCLTNQDSLKIKVAAPAPPAPTPPAGPDYTCTFSTNLPDVGMLPSYSGPVPFLTTVTGQHTTGSTDVVSLAPNLAGENIAKELGDLGGLGIKATAFAAKVPVTGAGHGAILVTGKTVGLTSKVLTGTGRLYLANPGSYHLRAPEVFTFALIGPTLPISTRTVAITITMTCKLTSADSVLAAITATGQPVPASGNGGSTNGSGTAASGAVPAGAPNTGGGAAPGSSLPLILGGAVLLLAGGGGTALALRRRRFSPPSV